MKQKNSGIFITFEGGEGAGKTTLIESLHAHFLSQNVPAVKTREPGGTSLGSHIRKLLLHYRDSYVDEKAELFLFLADRSQHVHELIVPHLRKGSIILCDRFNDSTLAYQGAARSIDPHFLVTLCNFASSNLKPDITFFLDIDPLIGLNRIAKSQEKKEGDRIEKERLDFHIKVRKAFLSFAKKEPSRFCTLDATLSTDQVFEKARDFIYEKFPLKNDGSFR